MSLQLILVMLFSKNMPVPVFMVQVINFMALLAFCSLLTLFMAFEKVAASPPSPPSSPFSPSVHSVPSPFRSLVAEFLRNNDQILRKEAQASLSSLGIHRERESRPWELSISSNRDKNKSNGLSSFGNRRGTITQHNLALNKKFIWGGGISLSNSLFKEQRDPNSALVSIFGTPPTSYEFRQSISYTQDLGANFLGRDKIKSLEQAKLSHEALKAQKRWEIQVQMMMFYQTYMNASLDKTLLKSQREGLKRAQKRTRLIQKRVRDGLRLSVDLMQARQAEIRQQEQVKSAEIQLHSWCRQLGQLLHRSVEPREIEPLDTSESIFKSLSRRPRLHQEQGQERGQEQGQEHGQEQGQEHGQRQDQGQNVRMQALTWQGKFLQGKLEQTRYHFLPQVQLSSRYGNNRYALERGKAISKGYLGQANYDFSVGLFVNLPLGFGLQKIAKAHAGIESKINQMEREKLALNLAQEERVTIFQIAQIEKSIKLVEKRLELAQDILKEYNSLYRLGKRNLDQVIAAEESLIATQISRANYLGEREKLLVQLADLQGDLKKYFLPGADQ